MLQRKTPRRQRDIGGKLSDAVSRHPRLTMRAYERERHRLKELVFGLINDLKKSNIIVEAEAKIERKKRKRTGHWQLIIKGIKTTGNASWQQSKGMIESKTQEIEGLFKACQNFAEAARAQGHEVHEFPSDWQKMFEAVRHFVLSKGQTVVRTGKKRIW